MKREYQTPGVYIDEISLLPKSIVQVETAVPAFVGFTEKAVFDGRNLHELKIIQPLEINSFSDYEQVFGGASEPAYVLIELDNNNTAVSAKIEEQYFMYYSVKLFFENGGETCIIVSVGNYSNGSGIMIKKRLLEGLAVLEKTDAPTLLVIPDTAKLSFSEAGEIHAAMLAQSHELNDRFALLDLVSGNAGPDEVEKPVENFRMHLGVNHLSRGAAYYPWLITFRSGKLSAKTILNAKYIAADQRIDNPADLFDKKVVDALNYCNFLELQRKRLSLNDIQVLDRKDRGADYVEGLYWYLYEFFNLLKDIIAFDKDDTVTELSKRHMTEGSSFHHVLKKLRVMISSQNPQLFVGNFNVDFSPLTFSSHRVFFKLRNRVHKQNPVVAYRSLSLTAEKMINNFYEELEKVHTLTMESLKFTNEVYKSVVMAIKAQQVVVPPCGAVAGKISVVDRAHGVWKAPANVSLNSVLRPAVAISQNDLQTMNVDAATGKSINAIRSFIGEGVLVWGARTLAGNSNEWRYINVRRFCIMVEQSVREAIRPFSFEQNSESTWQKVKLMTENFLYSLWQQGALAGNKPQQAFYVKAGLGITMTTADIESGIMNLEIGLATLRPAEFIVLKISHKMQVS